MAGVDGIQTQQPTEYKDKGKFKRMQPAVEERDNIQHSYLWR